MFLLAHIKRYDWLLMGAVFLLIALGLVTLFSLSGVSSAPFFQRQLLWAGIGICILVMVSFIDFQIFRTQRGAVILFYIFSILLLVGVLLAGRAIRGIDAWFRVGAILFQPVELAKLALIILLAKYFSKRHVEIYRMKHLVASGVYAALPTALVLFQPDLGSAIILFSIWFFTIILSGIRLRHFFLLIIVSAVVFVFAWSSFLAPYQKDRITAFLNPQDDPQGAGYQMIQSMIAMGSGRIFGKGLGYGSQSHLNFLPESETDFIFAAFAEEWGFVGSFAVLILFFIVLWRVIAIGILSADNFSQLYTIGFSAFIFVQSIIHIGMNMGLLPVTGITLPFVSYGGSSLVVLLVGVGITQNIHMRARRAVREGL